MSQLQSSQQVLFAFAHLTNYVSFGRSRIYSLIEEGKFPAPVKVGKSSRWVKSEIDTWLSERVTARNSLKAQA
jgi:prophage regulatory protein